MTRKELYEEKAKLGRPQLMFSTNLATFEKFKTELDEWKTKNPDGEDAYVRILTELDALDAQDEQIRLAKERLERWGVRFFIPRRVNDALAQPIVTDALGLAQKWIQQDAKPWLVLLGATGTGKSVAAAWAMRMHFDKSKTVAWVDVANLARSIGGFDAEQSADKVKSVDVLVMDDLGSEYVSDFAKSVMREVLQFRYEQKLKTILTSNLNGQAFRDYLGLRLSDRIRGECMSAHLTGKSLRPQS